MFRCVLYNIVRFSVHMNLGAFVFSSFAPGIQYALSINITFPNPRVNSLYTLGAV